MDAFPALRVEMVRTGFIHRFNALRLMPNSGQKRGPKGDSPKSH
jgi:hypothetical protein